MDTEKLANDIVSKMTFNQLDASFWIYICVAIISGLFAGLGAYFGSYLRKKGEILATKEDVDDIKKQLQETTETVELVKADISHKSYIEQSKWDFKQKYYTEIIKILTEYKDLLSSGLSLLKEKKRGGLENDEWKNKMEKATTEIRRLSKLKEVAAIFIGESINQKLEKLKIIINFDDEKMKSLTFEGLLDIQINSIEDLIKELQIKAREDLFK